MVVVVVVVSGGDGVHGGGTSNLGFLSAVTRPEGTLKHTR